MGGVRGVKHYMQRTALQSSPAMIAAITEQYVPGAPKHIIAAHPFRLKMSELHIGDTWETPARTITLEDIEHFAEFTGDKFYAHMDEEAAKASPIFEGRVAHGYFLLSFAAGLFVDPDPGPVLANTGLENLRFLTPVYPGDSIRVELTVRAKSIKSEDTGQVRWAVEVFNQKDELVATYDLLTENVPYERNGRVAPLVFTAIPEERDDESQRSDDARRPDGIARSAGAEGGELHAQRRCGFDPGHRQRPPDRNDHRPRHRGSRHCEGLWARTPCAS